LLLVKTNKLKDAGGIAPYALSTDGIQNFKDRIAIFRKYAPNTLLSSSGGFWTVPYGTTLNYAAFKAVDNLLDFRSTLYSAVSNNDSCCWRQLDGQGGATTMFTDGATITNAVESAAILNARNSYMNNFWGTTTRKWYGADVAVTDCGWGVYGQASIIQNLVNNLPAMFAAGFRGMVFRDISAPSQYRFMGYNNEAGFTWYPPSSGIYATGTAVQNGLSLAAALMKSKVSTASPSSPSSPSTPAPTVQRTVTAVSPGWNSWWIQVYVTPSSDIVSGSASYVDATGTTRTLTLGTVAAAGSSQWMGGPPSAIPLTNPVTITFVNNQGGKETYTIYNGQPITVSKVTPGMNSWWIQVGVTPSDYVSTVTAQYADWNGYSQQVTLTKNTWGQYMGSPPNQIPYGAQVNFKVTLTDGSIKSYSLTSGVALTVTKVAGSWNSWWLQINISPNSLVTGVTASFYDSTGWKRVVGLTAISGTSQYMASPTAQLSSNQEVVITVTLSDGTSQTYSLYNTASRDDAVPRPHDIKDTIPVWIQVIGAVCGFFLTSTVLAVVILGILKLRRSGAAESYSPVDEELVETPQSPTDQQQPDYPGEEIVHIEEDLHM
jgi:hypothetical protein